MAKHIMKHLGESLEYKHEKVHPSGEQRMPVEINEDGTVNCIPPWSLIELLEVTGYEFRQGENGIIVVTRPQKPIVERGVPSIGDRVKCPKCGCASVVEASNFGEDGFIKRCEVCGFWDGRA